MSRALGIRGKLIVLLLGTTIPVLALAGWLGYRAGRTALEDAIFNHLTTVRETKAAQVESYFQTIRNQVETLSENPMVVDAMRQFTEAFTALPDNAGDGAAVKRYYETSFLPRYRAQGDPAADAKSFLPTAARTVSLQRAYLAENPHPLGEKDKLDAAEGDAAYHAVHRAHHRFFRKYLQRFGYYDIFLVDAATGHIVYSVFKETDFATSLLTGPYRETNIAAVFREARRSHDADAIHLADHKAYPPSYGAPAAFVASPIHDGNRTLGVLIFQMPVDEINRVMTGDRRWREDGLGESGETYLVGPDRLMRSVSRFLLQDPELYFRQLRDLGTDPALIDRMRDFETTILLQGVDTEASRRALADRPDTSVVDDYRGLPVLSSYRKLDVEGLDWAILSEIDASEAFAPVASLRTQMIRWGLVLLVVIALLAWLLARRFVRPIQRLSDAAGQMAEGHLDARVETRRTDEIGALALAFNEMAASIEANHRTIAERSAENERLLLNILPQPIASRLRGGESRIADAFPEVSVLFADIVDFTKLSARIDAAELVALLNDLFTDFDALVLRHGVEKIKTIGDCYMAVCGVPHPVEAPAHVMAELTLELLDVLQAFNERRGSSFRLRIGLNCGPVVAGVIGSSKFIYDLWGDTVNMASRMESTGEPGTIQVTEAMYTALQADYLLEPRGLVEVKGAGMTPVYLLKGRRSAEPLSGSAASV